MQALLLTGTGLNNLGALRACGLNAEEAKQHLRFALDSRSLKDDDRKRVESLAAEALAWCEMEVGVSPETIKTGVLEMGYLVKTFL